MHSVDISTLISVISVSAAIFFGWSAYKSRCSAEEKADENERATIAYEVRAIRTDLAELKKEMKDYRDEVAETHRKVIILERDLKTCFTYIDELRRKEVFPPPVPPNDN